MSAYYNEHDPKAAAWLRELIQAGEIPAGDVDERSIVDVQPADLARYIQCHFFAGIGGWSYALRLAGWPTDRPVWTGSCPCQPFSSAGKSGGGAIRAIFGQRGIASSASAALQSSLVSRLKQRVCDDLEREGYAVGAVGLPAASVGAPHIRQRLWFVADATSERYGRASEPSRPSSYRLQSVSGNGASEQLADALNHRTGRPSEAQSSGDGSHDGVSRTDGAVDLMGYADDPRPQGHRRPVAEYDKAGRQGTERHGAASGAWADLVWLPCRDGKSRPTQSGLQPLAARLPGELVPSGDPSESYADASTEARVMRLRGYGNSIVAQVAAEVISSYMDMGSVEEALAL